MRSRFVVPLLASLLSSAALAAETPASKPEEKSTTGRNRGPENPVLKHHLPVPPVLSVEDSIKAMKVEKGYRVEIVASEPMIETPVAISWDHKGRLYVCEMRGYMNDMNAAGEDQPIGRISRLEDTDGDGKMDKATVFADKLLMPRAVMAMGDGAVVSVPPKLIFFHDSNDDGVADKSEVLDENYAREGGQPEHMANSLLWCQDNWIYSAAHPMRYRWLGGKWISDPSRSVGQWGLSQDDWGRRYFDYNSDTLRCDLLPPAMYARNPNVKDALALNYKLITDQAVWPLHPTPGVNRGYQDKQLRDDGTLATVTAACSPLVYRGDALPAFRGNVFVCEPTGNLVTRLSLTEKDGVLAASHTSKGSEFLASKDERFRPVNLNDGPDGALYITDIARGIVQHKAFITHYLEANIKERKLEIPINLGRIWRVVPDKGAKPARTMLPSTTTELVGMLEHPNGLIRDTAQRVLVERGDAAAVPVLKELASKAKTPQGRVHALWTLDAMGALTTAPEVVSEALKDSKDKVRVAAVRLASVVHVPQLVTMANDPSGEVRLHLAAMLSAQPSTEARDAVMAISKKGAGPLLNDAIATGIRGRELEWLEQSVSAKPDSVLVQMLANAVMNERRSARVTRLLELTSQQPAGAVRTAMINGIAGVPLDKKSKVVKRKMLYLEAEPAALAALKKGADKKTLSLISGINESLAWPGKPGVPPPPVVKPLTADQQKLAEQGKLIFAGLCAACHQPTGTGLDGLAPPLVDSDWLLGPSDRPIKIVLHGLSGPVEVGGRTWRLEMPPVPVLSDEQIAGVLTYLRREWEHTSGPVSPQEVAKVRADNAKRAAPWTATELKPAKKK